MTSRHVRLLSGKNKDRGAFSAPVEGIMKQKEKKDRSIIDADADDVVDQPQGDKRKNKIIVVVIIAICIVSVILGILFAHKSDTDVDLTTQPEASGWSEEYTANNYTEDTAKYPDHELRGVTLK